MAKVNQNISPVRSRERLSQGWRFHRGEPAGATVLGGRCTGVDYDDSGWRQLDIPHDWGIEDGFDINAPGETGKLNCQGVGWYRRKVHIDALDLRGSVHLEIDGAMSNSSVWVNGTHVGGWAYGYSSFALDITPWLAVGGDNVIAIRLENYSESSRWYTGGGLYRHVWLRRTQRICVAHQGVSIITQHADAHAAVLALTAEIENSTNDGAWLDISVHVRPADADEARPVRACLRQAGIFVAGTGQALLELEMRLENPARWEPGSPNLYIAEFVLEQEGVELDRYEVEFGIRTVHFDARSGFYLNGRRTRLQGVCLHHDLGPLGAAINPRAMERQLEILRDMGANAIRCSHNPPAPEWLQLCDRMGFLVIDELTDCWREGKKRNDYHSVFDSWVVKDIRAMVRRDRNHPCIILWSIGNEISEQLTAGGADLSSQLRALVRAQDPSRGITAGMNFVESGFNGFQHTVDVFGWNYKPMHYGQFIESNPGIPLYGSETSSCVSSRGEYFFPVSGRREDSLSGFQVSSYDIYYPHWATTPDVEFEHQDRHPSVAGEFVWTGFDYLGEPTPYNDDQANLLNAQNESDRKIIASEIDMNGRQPMPARSSYFGIVDLCGFRKDRFYLYQARWRPDLPMVHILPHWNWPERIGEVTPVHVYTAADEVELFLNGKSMGRKRRDTYSYRFRWDDVRYEPGELRAVSYKDGDLWAETVRRTTGPAFAIELVADRTSIQSDNDDVAFVTVRVVDKNGLLVPREKSLVKLEIEGPGKCIAVDNGDPSRLEPFFAQECRVFNGLALAVLKFQREPDGPFTLIARGEGLSEARLTISALSPIFQPDDPVCISG